MQKASHTAKFFDSKTLHDLFSPQELNTFIVAQDFVMELDLADQSSGK